MNENTKKIIELSDGKRTSVEIADLVGLSPRYVRKVMKKFDLPRLGEGARPGSDNHQFVSGRRIDYDGYVLITAPSDHPFARKRTNRSTKLMYEHRHVAEKKIGRYLRPEEVVDHIDGLTLHNAPENLRVFATNSEHLAATISGKQKMWSPMGFENIGARTDCGVDIEPVDSYRLRRERGDVRLRQILLAALKLGIDSPHLSGTRYWLEKAQISDLSRPNLELELAKLSLRWASDHVPSKQVYDQQHTLQAP